MKKTYTIEGIDCANCAMKIEEKINKIKGVEEANLNFMMGKLSIIFKGSTEDEIEEVMVEVKKIVKKIEPEAVIS